MIPKAAVLCTRAQGHRDGDVPLSRPSLNASSLVGASTTRRTPTSDEASGVDGLTDRGDTPGMADPARDVDEDLLSLPAGVRPRLVRAREVIGDAVPDGVEKISYGMPMLTLGGRNLISFAAWKNHIGIYPIPAGDDAFQAQIAPYRDAKATAKFPHDQPIPYDLIARMATLLAAERAPD